jgi:hypothetical protein
MEAFCNILGKGHFSFVSMISENSLTVLLRSYLGVTWLTAAESVSELARRFPESVLVRENLKVTVVDRQHHSHAFNYY